MLGKIGCDGHLAAIQCRVAEAVEALVGVDLECDEISSWGRDQYFCVRDLHRASSNCIRKLPHLLCLSQTHSLTTSMENFRFAERGLDPSLLYYAPAEAQESSQRTESR